MSIFFFLLFFLSCTSYVLCTNNTKNDEYWLLKMKKQLGNPDMFRSWVKGFDYCETAAVTATAIVYATCTETGRVSGLRMKNLDVSAPFPTAICGLTELHSFEIYQFPGLHGPIPSCVTKLFNLRGFIVEGTSLSGSVPKFHNNTNLTVISLPGNNLSGTIPRSFSTLPNLQSLDLSSNNLTGTIPPGIIPGGTSMLILSNNNLTGKIPKSYGSVGLWVIIVSNNQLSGDASFLFGKQKNTANIDLAHNNFEFNLSNVEFPDKLMFFDISHNKIYGNVPDSFARDTALLTPNLSFNKLCGELPKGGNMGKFNAAVFANNTCLCGYPLPPCSNSAPAPASAPAYS